VVGGTHPPSFPFPWVSFLLKGLTLKRETDFFPTALCTSWRDSCHQSHKTEIYTSWELSPQAPSSDTRLSGKTARSHKDLSLGKDRFFRVERPKARGSSIQEKKKTTLVSRSGSTGVLSWAARPKRVDTAKGALGCRGQRQW